MEIVGILLAAGRSSRYGANKLLQPLAGGLTVAEASARALAGAVEHWLAVVAADGDPELERRLAALGGGIVACPDAAYGMGHSIARGVGAARQAAGWIIALADMPAVQAATIRDLRAALLAGSPIAAPCRDGRRGNPVGFSSRFLPDLLALAGDRGARALVEAHRESVAWIETADPGIFLDVDTPADLRSLANRSPPSWQ